jgi:hypothetical protein
VSSWASAWPRTYDLGAVRDELLGRRFPDAAWPPHLRFRNPVINGHDTSTIIHACADVTFPCSQNASRAAGSGTHNLMIRTVQYEGWNSLYRRRIGRVTTTARAENRTTRPRAATFSGPSKWATLTGLSGQGRPSLPFHGCGTHAGSRTTSGLVPPRPRSVAESTLYWSALQRRCPSGDIR